MSIEVGKWNFPGFGIGAGSLLAKGAVKGFFPLLFVERGAAQGHMGVERVPFTQFKPLSVQPTFDSC